MDSLRRQVESRFPPISFFSPTMLRNSSRPNILFPRFTFTVRILAAYNAPFSAVMLGSQGILLLIKNVSWVRRDAMHVAVASKFEGLIVEDK